MGNWNQFLDIANGYIKYYELFHYLNLIVIEIFVSNARFQHSLKHFSRCQCTLYYIWYSNKYALIFFLPINVIKCEHPQCICFVYVFFFHAMSSCSRLSFPFGVNHRNTKFLMNHFNAAVAAAIDPYANTNNTHTHKRNSNEPAKWMKRVESNIKFSLLINLIVVLKT